MRKSYIPSKMKIRISLIILTGLFINTSSVAQDDLTPDIIMPSPSAYQITKYGDVPINESSGRISPSIPIYTFKAGQLELPISLNYMGNGVKVDDLSGWTGINWTLNAGGAITRIVKDRADEQYYPERRINYDYEYLSNLTLIDEHQDVINLNSIASNDYDTEVDLFQFSFPGYSGSFYLDEELMPVLINYENELKIYPPAIDIENGIIQFIIVTPDGIMYYFGGENSNEVERTRINPQIPESITANTAFYLYKIVHPLGDEIFLKYEVVDDYFIRLSKSNKITDVVYTQTEFCQSVSPTSLDLQTSILNLNIIINGVYLSEITSNKSDVKLKFISTPTDLGTEYPRVLNTIQIIETITNNYKNINLDYIRNSQRFFLREVVFEGSNSQEISSVDPFEYKMEYNDPDGLPDRLSYSQDHLGYFNGANNSTLLPKNNSIFFEHLNSLLADREPNFEYAAKGSLERLYYPTGGFTHFEYEATPKKAEAKKTVHLNAFCTQPNINPNTILKDSYTFGYVDELQVPHFVFKNQTINVNIDVIADALVTHHYKVYIRMINLTDNTVEPQEFTLFRDILTYHKEYSFFIEEGKNYKLELELVPDPDSQNENPYPVDINLNFEYVYGYENVDGLGLRIKRVSDYTSIDSKPLIKRYYYKKANKIDEEFEDIYQNVSWVSYMDLTHYNNCGITNSLGTLEICSYTLINLYSNALDNIFPYNGNTTLYRYVTVSYGGDFFENGGIEKSFNVLYQLPVTPFFDWEGNTFDKSLKNKYDNSDIYGQTLVKETYLQKNIENKLYKEKTIEYAYNYDDVDTISNLLITRVYSLCSNDYERVEGLYIGTYNTYSKKQYLMSIASTDYIDPLPYEEFDYGLYKKIISKTDYKYETMVGLPTEIFRFTGFDDKVLIIKNIYPDNDNSLSNITDSEKYYYDRLYQEHIYAQPIQIENFIGKGIFSQGDIFPEVPYENSLIKTSTKRIIYDLFFRPDRIQMSKGEFSLEDKIRFVRYGYKGNIMEYKKENDLPISIIWAYNQSLPVAKIEGIAYDEFMSNLSNTIQSIYDDQALRDALNVLRTQYPDAMVSTYTYNPLIGMTSYTDPNGKTSYYEYDGHGRLIRNKDHNEDILKEIDYHFKSINISNF